MRLRAAVSAQPWKYKSVSACAPIANPVNCPWGQKAFGGYFGEEQREKWNEHDATELVKSWKGHLDVLIDVVGCLSSSSDPGLADLSVPKGTHDNFYKQSQLLSENFDRAARAAGIKGVNVRYQPGYDHSYYTMASFSEDHIEHAAKYLLA